MSNLSDTLNDIFDVSSGAIEGIGDIIGTLADVGGAIGLVTGAINLLLHSGQPDLSAILDAINRDFAQLGKEEEANQLLQRSTTLNNLIGPALTQLESLQAEISARPSQTEIVAFIEPCVTALNNLGGAIQPDIVWNVAAEWPIYWTDSGQFSSICYYTGHLKQGDVGYGTQKPPLNDDGLTVFYYTYSLPLYLFSVSIFLAVAGSLDQNFATNYAGVIRSAAALLISKYDLIFQTDADGDVRGGGITQLTPPNWAASNLLETSCRGDAVSPTAGIRITYQADDPIVVPLSATIEYGAVEKYSGYSSVGDNYKINFENPRGVIDPATFFKFQLRLLKRTKDVYVSIGLQNVWKVINSLKALVGDPPLPSSNYGDWSFRQIFRLANLEPTVSGYSVRALGAFVIQTPPFDTPYSLGATRFSVRALLTKFSD